MMTDDGITPRENFIETMGLIVQADGGPRIAGRMVGLMIIERQPFTLNAIAARLQISKASASTNARQLLSSGILRLTTKPGDRQDYYEIGPDPFKNMLETITGRMHRAAEQIGQVSEQFGDEDPEGRARVEELRRFYASSAKLLRRWAAHLDDENDDTDVLANQNSGGK